jgi:hypothetical protein
MTGSVVVNARREDTNLGAETSHHRIRGMWCSGSFGGIRFEFRRGKTATLTPWFPKKNAGIMPQLGRII